MKYLKYYKLFEKFLNEESKKTIRDIGLSLMDVGVNIYLQDQSSKLVMYITRNFDFNYDFTINDIKYEVEHIISYLTSNDNCHLKVCRYRNRNQWVTLYDENNNVDHWGVTQNIEDIFDVQDKDFDKEISSFELIFEK